MQLKGKTAIITGASRGIGRAIALSFAKAGANVAINYSSSHIAAQEVVNEAIKYGVKAEVIKADVSDYLEVENLIERVLNEYGSIDILVNNAGITKDNLLLRMTEEDFDKVMNINMKGTFNFTKAVSKVMVKQRKGKIINIASVVGIIGNAGQSNYAAAKAGIIGFTKSVAKELGSRGINVNAIAPGFIETDMTAVLSDKIREQFTNTIPLKRPGKPEDVANAALFLASDYSDYITGQVLNIDGGMVM
ncbi:3-oxoacyl-[acyl-carrier-protein] reductase [Lutispora thermophila]|uniref:3-oxoacyl-[acyl-carrier-protein] reductase n=1 Tax=Lutispora thermophila DSM 19022 TaxID=1122184 RepID=A0A1M6G4K7_9FIRM|nr:3-oxoacyl-[acyl-carrier-protein] reductase [Lutispora thermophila]SHJ04935.1 3-oxoacyl-[acyl-carrier-protein] reductase [Lutispora thermophila DSM 19022]